METALVQRAEAFAWRVHRDQRRKYVDMPYFTHLAEVAELCSNSALDAHTVATAFLHDAMEDQGVTYETLREQFCIEVADMVLSLTDTPPGPGLNRKRRKAIDRGRLAVATPGAQSVKCADLISNTQSIALYDPEFAKVYLPEKRLMLAVLTRADPLLLAMAEATLEGAEDELRRLPAVASRN